LRRLSSRLNSASGGIIAVRLLHGVRESVSRIDDSPANRPQADPAVFGRGEGLGRGLMLGRGPVRRGGPGPDWVKLGQNGRRAGGAARGQPRDGHRRPDKLRWNNADGVYFMPSAPNRQTVAAVGIWLRGSGIPDESRDKPPCLSRLCLTSGCIICDARRILGGLVACPAWCKLGT
jgi:hypothetical protein